MHEKNIDMNGNFAHKNTQRNFVFIQFVDVGALNMEKVSIVLVLALEKLSMNSKSGSAT